MDTKEKIITLAKDIQELYRQFAKYQPNKNESIEYLKKCGEVYEVYISTLQLEELSDSSEEKITELESTKKWLIEELKTL